MAPLVFITGASSGIGQALAARYLHAGWRLALVARRGDSLRDWAAQRGPSRHERGGRSRAQALVISVRGGWPNLRAYSRLNCVGLS